MPALASTAFLVTGMLTTGAANSILSKWQVRPLARLRLSDLRPRRLTRSTLLAPNPSLS